MKFTRGVTALALVAVVVAACSGPAATPVPTDPPAESPAASTGALPANCTADQLALKNAGTLTIGADNPAYPPYFARRDGGNTPPWEDSEFTGDPTTGEGFESAVAYAVADTLGFAKEDVNWIVVPFNNSFAPGAKDFDFYITQVSFTRERARAVDMSAGYYFVNQAVVTLKDSPLASVTGITQLRSFTFGAQVGTTSFTTIERTIRPRTETQVFDSNDLAIEALKSGQIDGIVVDLPTADFITNVQEPNAVAIGRFDTGLAEFFSLVLERNSDLTSCVNSALAVLRADGTLDALVDEWLPYQASVPQLAP